MTAATVTILVHIGSPKTGTTTLQGWLSRNRPRLAAQGICYPLDGVNHNDLYLALCDAPHLEHAMIRRGHTQAAAARSWADQFAGRLAEAIKSSRAPTVLLSAESLSRLSPAGVQRLARWLGPLGEARIVCCLRDPLGYAVSDAQEAIKGGLTYEQVCRDPPVLDIRALLEPCLAEFGRSRVTVFPFAPETGLDRGFAAATGVPVAFDPDDPQLRRNEALSMEAALLLGDLNHRIPMFEGAGVNPARGAIPTAWLARIGSTPFSLPARSLARVRRRARAQVAWVRTHLGLELEPANEVAAAGTRTAASGGVSRAVAALLPGIADTLNRAACLAGDLMAERLLAEAGRTQDRARIARLLEQALMVRPGHARALGARERLTAGNGLHD